MLIEKPFYLKYINFLHFLHSSDKWYMYLSGRFDKAVTKCWLILKSSIRSLAMFLQVSLELDWESLSLWHPDLRRDVKYY